MFETHGFDTDYTISSKKIITDNDKKPLSKEAKALNIFYDRIEKENEKFRAMECEALLWQQEDKDEF